MGFLEYVGVHFLAQKSVWSSSFSRDGPAVKIQILTSTKTAFSKQVHHVRINSFLLEQKWTPAGQSPF